jgi:hypothetical protein
MVNGIMYASHGKVVMAVWKHTKMAFVNSMRLKLSQDSAFLQQAYG